MRARLGKEAHASREASAAATAPPASASGKQSSSGSGAGPYGVEAARRLAADFARLGSAAGRAALPRAPARAHHRCGPEFVSARLTLLGVIVRVTREVAITNLQDRACTTI